MIAHVKTNYWYFPAKLVASRNASPSITSHQPQVATGFLPCRTSMGLPESMELWENQPTKIWGY
jgi:hypothetical protein